MTIPTVNASDPLAATWGDAVADLLNGVDVADYTPELGNGWAKGGGTVSGRYLVLGGRCFFSVVATFAADSTFGAGSPSLTMPIASHSGWIGHEANCWRGIVIDNSDSARQYAARGVSQTTTTFLVYALSSAGTYLGPAQMSSTVPFTWAINDSIRIMGSYWLP